VYGDTSGVHVNQGLRPVRQPGCFDAAAANGVRVAADTAGPGDGRKLGVAGRDNEKSGLLDSSAFSTTVSHRDVSIE
jgi:hypothetical protein